MAIGGSESSGGYKQPLIFDPSPAFFSSYDDDANAAEAGFLGVALYDAPGIVTGGQQINVDLSSLEASPQVWIAAAKNPQWLMVVLGIIMLYLTWKNGKR